MNTTTNNPDELSHYKEKARYYMRGLATPMLIVIAAITIYFSNYYSIETTRGLCYLVATLSIIGWCTLLRNKIWLLSHPGLEQQYLPRFWVRFISLTLGIIAPTLALLNQELVFGSQTVTLSGTINHIAPSGENTVVGFNGQRYTIKDSIFVIGDKVNLIMNYAPNENLISEQLCLADICRYAIAIQTIPQSLHELNVPSK